MQPGSSAAVDAALSPPTGLLQPIIKPFTRLQSGMYLHNRPEKDVHIHLIDAYRLRLDDDYNFDGDAPSDSIYGGAPDSLQGFQRFLALAGQRFGLLPPWWNAEKQSACEKMGIAPERWQWGNLRTKVTKKDIIDRYSDARFPMQIRMLAEVVYQRGPGGANGTHMLKTMVGTENGANALHTWLSLA
ncbi:hypothetical protein F5Y15DRAFT_254415 [Xylariaceae sp. FL0016]|nr:hypothetical protein F5Y15DRAFT_254415 [Xylariaceae sp. FL0016]